MSYDCALCSTEKVLNVVEFFYDSPFWYVKNLLLSRKNMDHHQTPETRAKNKMFMRATMSLIFCVAVAALVIAVLAFTRTNSTELTISSLKGVSGPITLTDALIYAGDGSTANQLGATNFTGAVHLVGNPMTYVLAGKASAIVSSSTTAKVDIFSGTMTLPSTFDATSMVVIQVHGRLSDAPADGTKTLELVIGSNAAVSIMTTTSVVANLQYSAIITIGSYVDATGVTNLHVSFNSTVDGVTTHGDAIDLDAWSAGQTIAVNMDTTAGVGDMVCYTGVSRAYPALSD